MGNEPFDLEAEDGSPRAGRRPGPQSEEFENGAHRDHDHDLSSIERRHASNVREARDRQHPKAFLAKMITLRPWAAGDRDLLDRTVGDREMMRFLGGAEDRVALDARHRRYLALTTAAEGGMFVMSPGPDAEPVGTIGFWESLAHGEAIFETGWMVFPQYAGRGYATQGALAIIGRARKAKVPRPLHAYPNVANAASNRVCERAGFENLGPIRFEYPRGSFMQCNDWRIIL